MSDPRITVYGRAHHGGRSCSIDLRGHRVLISSGGPEQDASAQALASDLLTADWQIEAARREAAHAKETAHSARADANANREALGAVLIGTRRFFGPVLLVPGAHGWDEEVWLLDPEKGERGTGLRFGSLQILWINHPELRPVGVHGQGILLDALALPETVPFCACGRRIHECDGSRAGCEAITAARAETGGEP